MNRPFLSGKAVFLSLFSLTIFGFALQAAAQTYVSRVSNGSGGYYIALKEISAAETWTKAGSPYIVECDVNFDNCGVDVLAGGSLTIDPGVVVRFTYGRGHASLIVRGTLTAVGTVAEPIVFSQDPAGYAQEWGGIQCLGGSSVNLSYVHVNNAGHVNSGWQTGFVGAALYVDSCSPTIQNCSLDSSRNDGIIIYRGAAPVITNCIVTNSADFAASGSMSQPARR
jgi:parallel beta-helix repeat protein